jgi:RsiW-degrading membrane proteinase PrsW (M82 family)
MAGITAKSILFAAVTGTVPALVWLWFWWREEQGNKSKSLGLIAISFIIGMTGVIVVIPIEKFAQGFIASKTALTLVWASLEEIIKYAAVAAIALKSRGATKPVDFPVFFITTALGFAALENTLFLLQPEMVQNGIVSLITGNLRFLGATLLHAVSSSMIGIAIGLAFYKSRAVKIAYIFCGIVTAVSLHAIFNLSIINSSRENFFTIFGFLWIVTIISMLLFEKLRRMSNITS